MNQPPPTPKKAQCHSNKTRLHAGQAEDKQQQNKTTIVSPASADQSRTHGAFGGGKEKSVSLHAACDFFTTTRDPPRTAVAAGSEW